MNKNKGGRPSRPAEVRFFERVRREGDCWVWTGALNNGYGQFRSTKSERMYAHRWAYEFFRAPIPEGLTLDHLCRRPACVNPDHLEPVPMRVNVLRGIGPSAMNARKTHCIRGHEFTPENTGPNGGGLRSCRTCTRTAKRRAAA